MLHLLSFLRKKTQSNGFYNIEKRMQFFFRINHTVILEDPFDDPPDLPVPDRSPEPTKEQLDVSTLPPSDTLQGSTTE